MATVNVVLGGHENRPVNSVDGLWNGDIEVMQIMIISLMMISLMMRIVMIVMLKLQMMLMLVVKKNIVLDVYNIIFGCPCDSCKCMSLEGLRILGRLAGTFADQNWVHRDILTSCLNTELFRWDKTGLAQVKFKQRDFFSPTMSHYGECCNKKTGTSAGRRK